MTSLSLRTHAPKNVNVLTFRGTTLREADLKEFRWRLQEAGEKVLFLDLHKVEFITAGGLSCLIALHEDIRDAGGHLTLCKVNAWPFEVMRICRLDGVLDVRRGKGISLSRRTRGRRLRSR